MTLRRACGRSSKSAHRIGSRRRMASRADALPLFRRARSRGMVLRAGRRSVRACRRGFNLPPRRGRRAYEPTERSIERCLGLVPDASRYLSNAKRTVSQQVSCQMHPPAGQILNRRLADQRDKSFGQRRAWRCRTATRRCRACPIGNYRGAGSGAPTSRGWQCRVSKQPSRGLG
jgi:hypothetical protein